MLFSEPKIPQSLRLTSFPFSTTQLSVLFSEPKIPQSFRRATRQQALNAFSALQRAENSSIFVVPHHKQPALALSVLFSEPKIPQCAARRYGYCGKCNFQCSSASRKFLNQPQARGGLGARGALSVLFSEPKIPQCGRWSARESSLAGLSVLFSEPKIPQLDSECRRSRRGARFQCSSASRKFLNPAPSRPTHQEPVAFSALQRAENSSIEDTGSAANTIFDLSVLFSEPKIPQSSRRCRD